MVTSMVRPVIGMSIGLSMTMVFVCVEMLMWVFAVKEL